MRSFSKVLSSPPVAEGRTAEIYLWDDQHVLKLYRDWCPPDWVEYEARIARLVYEAGIPSPEATEIIELDGRRGLIYQRLEGISIVQDLKARPWTLFKHAHSLAELQFRHEKSTIGYHHIETDYGTILKKLRISRRFYAEKPALCSSNCRMVRTSVTVIFILKTHSSPDADPWLLTG